MRDHTSEPTKKRMPTGWVISWNVGPNRATRRHIKLEAKEGQVHKQNKPYISRDK